MFFDFSLIIEVKINDLLLIDLSHQVVEPHDSEAKPSVAAHFHASKPEDKVAIGTLLEREPYIHEIDVTELALISIADGSPNGSRGRIEQGMALTLGSQIPQIGIIVGIDAYATSNNLAAPDCSEQPTAFTLS